MPRKWHDRHVKKLQLQIYKINMINPTKWHEMS